MSIDPPLTEPSALSAIVWLCGLLVATSGDSKLMIDPGPIKEAAVLNAVAAAIDPAPGASAPASDPEKTITPPNALGATTRQHTSAARRTCLVIDIFVLTPPLFS
jgi:hypothetical protein